MRPVLLGMNNPISSDPRHALFPYPPGCTGHRLLVFSGLSRSTYLESFERRNVLPGQDWSAARAREVSPGLRRELLGRRVVLLGIQVNSVVRGGSRHELAGPWRWTPDDHGGWHALVPHLSGRSHFYNDHLNRALLAIFMAELAEWSREHAADPLPGAEPFQLVG